MNDLNSKVKKGFYEILWSMCEKEGILANWILEDYLGKSKNTYYWTAKAMREFQCEIIGDLTINNETVELSSISLEYPQDNKIPTAKESLDNIKAKKEQSKIDELDVNQLEEFIGLFHKKNIGLSGKTTPKVTVAKKLIKFFKDYPDYTMSDIIEATKLYIANLKKQGSIRFIRECGYFISKKIDGVEQSDLAKWCEEYKEGGQSFTDYSSHTLL